MYSKKNTMTRKLLSCLLTLALALGMAAPAGLAQPALAVDELVREQPLLLVTGLGLIGDTYSSVSVSKEKSYTLGDLQALNGGTYVEQIYSANSNTPARRLYRGVGVDLADLMALSGYSGGTVSVLSLGDRGMTVSVDLSEERFYYPNFDNSESTRVGAMLAWQSVNTQVMKAQDETEWSSIPDLPSEFDDPLVADANALRLMLGQMAPDQVTTSLYNSNVSQLHVGGAVTDKPITVLGTAYTRGEMMMMPRAERSYTYSSSSADRNDRMRGVPLAVLLDDLGDNAMVEFHAADGYDLSSYSMSKAELVGKNAILAYEKYENGGWVGVYSTDKATGAIPGYFTLYLDGERPAQMIDTVFVTPSTDGSYKHIDYSGAPYNLDAITGATLTVEGPGVQTSTPITVKELEGTAASHIHRGVYHDYSHGARTYEGVALFPILDGAVNTNVRPLDASVVVVFKNRWRQEIGRLTYEQIRDAATPVMLAYGIAAADGSDPSPFVFTGATGENTILGNGDGPLKLVFDRSEFPGFAANDRAYQSVAYLYIEEGVPPPGFKHTGATDAAYSNKTNTEYLVTFTGDALGREVSYTVAELEAMVEYESGRPAVGGKGYRDEYGLSNTTYWYVNEYEGIKVWDLLTSMGVDPAIYANDDSTLVSFSAWDNYRTNAVFSMRQLADPEVFYFYEKSPLDIGTTRPTKEQLATPAYQPDNQGAGWVTDGNGYPVKKGYPVMLAYGVNGYPYVRDSGLPGFKSGLGNDGGPLRVIYGKTDGLNRSDPAAIDNYAYFFNNGSNQMQRVQEVYVGDPVRYSTHVQNPASDYQAMIGSHALTVEIVIEGKTTAYDFTFGELEGILYGADVTKRDRDNEGRQEKGYYYYKNSGAGDKIEDLFEGVSLEYLLAEHIGLQGTLGNIALYSGSNSTPSAVFALAAVGEKGYNSVRGTEDLGMAVAFAKNGYPLVGGSGDTPGYVSEDKKTGKTIKNNGGPLQFVRGQSAAEYATGAIVSGSAPEENKTSVENLTRIVVDLDPDAYAHTGSYETYADETVLFSGAVALQSGVSLTVGKLETMQKYMVTGAYTVDGVSSVYRGLHLFNLLQDKAIGVGARMDGITVKNEEGQSKTLTVADLTGTGKTPILAYGVAKGGDAVDGKPLVPGSGSPGYDADYENVGGPLRLIIDGGAAGDCITHVTGIEVSAAGLAGWKHDYGVFAAYADDKLEISGQNLAQGNAYTVAELEAMDNIVVFDTYSIGNAEFWVQGVSLYQLLQNIGFVGTMDTSSFTAYASDGYAVQFDGTQLKNGINGKPILVAYGQGTTSVNGLPLVEEITSPGFDPNVNNAFGPLRLVVHDNSGWSVKYLAKIVVGASGTVPPPKELDFNVYGLASGTVSFDIRGIKNSTDFNGKAMETFSYTSGGAVTDTVRGAYLYDILRALGVSDTATVTVNTTDGYEASQTDYRDVPMSVIEAQGYFVAYDVGPDADHMSAVGDADKQAPPVIATVRMYRNYNEGGNWRNRLTNVKGVTVSDIRYDFQTYAANQKGLPNAGVRSLSLDSAGGLWAGTYGGGLAYLPKGADAFSVYNTTSSPVLLTDFATAVAADSDGGVWFSQNASYTAPGDNRGVGYMKDGDITWYRASDSPATIPNDYVQAIEIDKDGNVWFGSFGGLTKYDVKGKTWSTWTKSEGLPAESVNTIAFDGTGGVWVGCYPDVVGSVSIPGYGQADTYRGGYAHMSAAGAIDFTQAYEATAENNLTAYLLADFWVRGIAVDSQGGAWVVRSGSYAGMPNVGGRVDYVDKDRKVTTYTGLEMLGKELTVDPAVTPELREIAVDKNGALWFGTSGDGLFHCTAPGQVYRVYNTANQALPPGTPMDNIYVLMFDGDTLYTGSNGGIAFLDLGTVPPPPPPPPPSGSILAIYNGSILAGSFSQSEIDEMAKTTNDYSTINTAGTYNTYPGVTGVNVMTLLSLAGLSPDDSREITFYAKDHFTTTLRVGDLTAVRYYFRADRSRGPVVPPVIRFEDEGGHLFIGALTAQEQTNQVFARSIDRIVLGGTAGAWDMPTASPASGTQVAAKSEITLASPSSSANAKIYYTLDGSTPSIDSAIYNVSRWQEQDNPPIKVPDGLPAGSVFTVKARIIGLGKIDSDVATFTYTIGVGTPPGSGASVGGGGGPGPATVVLEVDALSQGDKPVVAFDGEKLSEKIQETIAAGGEKTLELRIKAAPTVTSVSAHVPGASIKEMIDKGIRYLILSNPLGANSLDGKALQSLYGQGETLGQGGKDVYEFLMHKVDPQSLDEVLQALVGGNALYEVRIQYDGKAISDFGDGQAITRINYTLASGQSAYGLKVWGVSADGTLTEIECAYNGAQGYVQFMYGSYSYYMVGYDEEAALWTANPFRDVKKEGWFYDVVRFVYERGLMAGTAADEFSPDMPLTRGMAVTVLHRLAGSPDASEPANPLRDVAETQWYAQAVKWAAVNGIVVGFGDGRFAPEEIITREQMASLFLRYQEFAGVKPPDIQEGIEFDDREQIGDWAKASVDALARQGIIGGKPGNLYDPMSGATRAEFAAILQRFINRT